eukprot:4349051-Pyramimonas_sp.AAC.1
MPETSYERPAAHSAPAPSCSLPSAVEAAVPITDSPSARAERINVGSRPLGQGAEAEWRPRACC